jgi:hypothetical protein
MQEELAQLKESKDHTLENTAHDLAFESNNDTRAHQVHPTDSSKASLVSTSPSPA